MEYKWGIVVGKEFREVVEIRLGRCLRLFEIFRFLFRVKRGVIVGF